MGLYCYRYSPTILLLRHFEVFRDSQSPEVSQNDQRGNTSEVASVIRRFTEPVGEHGDSNSLGKSNGEFVRFNVVVTFYCYHYHLSYNIFNHSLFWISQMVYLTVL